MTAIDNILLTSKPEEHKKVWEEFNKVINGELTFKENIYANVNGPIYKFEIFRVYENIEFTVEQAIIIRPSKNDLYKPVIFRIEKESSLEINLDLWEKDWSDRLFGKRKLKTGDPNFDKNYALGGNKKEKILGLFSNEIIRKGFLNDRGLIFKVKTENNKIIFELKKAGFIPNHNEFEKLYNFYLELIKESKAQNIL